MTNTLLVRGPLPLWFQIKERLRRDITSGVLTTGARIPTEHELMGTFGVSRTTARSAVEALAREGLVERERGRGTFVAHRLADQPAYRLAGFHDDMRLRGAVPSTQTREVRIVRPGDDDELRLGLGPDARVVFIERLLLADGEPIGLQRSHLPAWVLADGPPFTKKELDSRSLYELLDERSGSRPHSAEQVIEARTSPSDIAPLLGIPKRAPVLWTERLSVDGVGSPVEWVELWYRADRYRFRVEIAGHQMVAA